MIYILKLVIYDSLVELPEISMNFLNPSKSWIVGYISVPSLGNSVFLKDTSFLVPISRGKSVDQTRRAAHATDGLPVWSPVPVLLRDNDTGNNHNKQ